MLRTYNGDSQFDGMPGYSSQSAPIPGTTQMIYSQNLKSCSLGLTFFLIGSAPALACAAVPAPLAGLAGPYGLLAAGVVYGDYRVVKHLRQSP
jgi:hypothetical protein